MIEKGGIFEPLLDLLKLILVENTDWMHEIHKFEVKIWIWEEYS